MNLEGIRVALTQGVTGPVSGQIRDEWGAGVVYAERASTGNVTRADAPFYKGESHYDRTFNRGKHSVTLDIAKPERLKTTRSYEERRCC